LLEVCRVPRVSIIVATYNQAGFIKESLESAFQQSFKDFEIVVVDDGSTDDTESVLEPYRDRIRYFYQTNSGPASAHNLGIENSFGQLVAFLNSDDLWLPHKLEIQVRYLDQHPEVGLVHGDYVRIDAEGRQIGSSIHTRRPPSLTFADLIRHNTIGMSTVVVRKKWLEKVSGLDPGSNPTEDFDLWLRLAQAGCRFAYVPSVVGKWRRHSASISASRIRVHQAHIRILRKLEGLCDARSAEGRRTLRMIRKKVLREKRILCMEQCREAERAEARRLALEIIRERTVDPRSWFVLGTVLLPPGAVGILAPLRQRIGKTIRRW